MGEDSQKLVWTSFSKTIVPVALRHNGTYDDMITSVIEATDGSRPILRISIARSLIKPTNSFNDNDSIENENLGDQPNESFCDNSNDNLSDNSMNKPILRISVIARSPIEPTNSFNDNDSVENENLGDQPKGSFYDHSNDNMGDYSMKMYDHSVDVKDQPVDAEIFEHLEEVQEKQELRLQPNHSFSDETNFYMYQTFSIKSELQLLLSEAATRKSLILLQ
ncbi:hypothetical protein RDI58_007257 [Solanum bulbocastanum]|uniref:Uncharacterized protein n=1 Tax=Solanum bulbocastanum TaxID=147425 RepID=A0AAN8TW50_SOLBU